MAAAAALILQPAAPAAERADSVRYPYVAALSRGIEGQRVYFCSGTLIAPQWLVTAAHCFHSRSGTQILTRNLWAVVGRDRLGRAGAEAQVAVERVFVHPGFDARSQRDDIALVRLAAIAGPLVADLPRTGEPKPESATVLGFGSFYEGELAARALSPSGAPAAQLSDELRRSSVRLLDLGSCRERLNRGDAPLEADGLCGTAAATNACTGDSGSPLVRETADGSDLLIGIVSLGTGCAEPNPLVLFTDVRRYRDWIDEILRAR